MSRSTILPERLTAPLPSAVNGHYAAEETTARGQEKNNGLPAKPRPKYPLTAEELAAIREKAIHIITKDDEPVDGLFTAKLQQLLVDALVSSWTPPPHPSRPDQPRTFVAVANVGVFDDVNTHGIVPDMMVSLDIHIDDALRFTHHRSYFLWEFGKPPDLVIEIVSDRRGGELSHKKARYAAMEVPYYVVYDSDLRLSKRSLQVFELSKGKYRLSKDDSMPGLGLKLILSYETIEHATGTWLRFADLAGNKLLFGYERAQQETARAKKEATRAKQAASRAQKAEAQVARLTARLRELGIDPQSV
ncbi:MAG: Uma2 family endonuclease [Acidobacteria bacterium]|nr:Uma2 family endonuclease [Acidobacteriota bacterium]